MHLIQMLPHETSGKKFNVSPPSRWYHSVTPLIGLIAFLFHRNEAADLFHLQADILGIWHASWDLVYES